MKGLARGVVWWPGIDAEIEEHASMKVKQYVQCQPATQTLGMANHPWSHLHINYAGPLMDKMFFDRNGCAFQMVGSCDHVLATSKITIEALR